jgi:hypothetical protein
LSITEEEVQSKAAVEDKIDKNILLNMTEVALFLIHSLMVIDLLIEEAAEMMKMIEDQWITDTKEDVVVVQTVVSKTVVVEKELMMETAITVAKRVILLSSVKHHHQDKEEVVTTDMVMTIERKDLSMLSD